MGWSMQTAADLLLVPRYRLATMTRNTMFFIWRKLFLRKSQMLIPHLRKQKFEICWQHSFSQGMMYSNWSPLCPAEKEVVFPSPSWCCPKQTFWSSMSPPTIWISLQKRFLKRHWTVTLEQYSMFPTTVTSSTRQLPGSWIWPIRQL